MLIGRDEGEGEEEYDMVCTNTLEQFAQTFKYLYGLNQWQADGIRDVNIEMWKAASDEPRLLEYSRRQSGYLSLCFALCESRLPENMCAGGSKG
jgi:hypothetical protein